MTTTTNAALIRDALATVRARWIKRANLEALARAGAGVAGIWGAAWIAVRVGSLAGPALLAAIAVGAIATAVWLPAAWRRRRPVPEDRLLARHVEDLHPSLEDRFATAVDVLSRPSTGPLDGALLADAARTLDRESIDDVVPVEMVRRAGWLASAIGVVGLALAILWIPHARRAFDVAGAYLFPSWLALEVTPGDARVAPGQPLEIGARLGVSDLVPEIEIAAAGRSKRLAMSPAGGAFRTRFDSVPGSFEYRVSAGGRSTRAYRVTLLEAPRLEGIDLHYEFPSYTRLPPRDERDGGDVYAPAGTQVRFSIRTSRATDTAALVMGGQRIPLDRIPDGAFATTLPIKADGSYRVALTSRDGLASPGDTEYFIRVLDDRPPEVRIIRPASDRQVTPLDEVTVEARADDDYGLQSFDLVYSVRGGQPRVVPFSGDRTPLTATGRHTLYLEDLDVAPGDFVTYYARARDVGRGKQATEARSDIYFLEVTPFDQEFSAAQSQAMSAGGGRSMDDLVAAQKDVVVATWKLDRRSGAGRSISDVQTVARAQADVRQRTEQAVATLRGPRRRPSAGAGEADPLASAALAMARAQSALEAQNTRAAVPPEMEALNHLLRAQAENRKREVMRQQAGTGGGGNRAQQDLSSLFDRELKRQQQTNYETPRTADAREQNAADDLLERLRALAARQEQLARQQDDFAKSRDQLEAEERRRRLERLTREQTEIRRQAEQLAQQLQSGRPDGQQRDTSSSRGQSSSSASGLRDASEEMQAAAGELRRDDPRQASQRSARAAERLRGLERQLQGQSPDERRRALGDLQLEARQLADRQRQVGEDASAAHDGAGAADAARRLAAEQDRLAERADRLEQQVEALGHAQKDPSAASVASAGRELKDQHVGDTMREAARALREGDGGAMPRAAGAGRQAARALDRLADRLGDASGTRDAAERRLSDQLARARDVRERMGELQRRIAELQRGSGNDSSPAGPGSQGQTPQPGQSAESSSPRPGGKGEGGQAPGTAGAQPSDRAELDRLQREYNDQVREASRLRGELEGRQGTTGGGDGGGSTPEGQLMVLSAPGTEAFKQDFSKWEVLHKDVTLGLERLEASLSQQLLDKALRERLPAGPADDAPDEYRDAVSRYFRAIASPRE